MFRHGSGDDVCLPCEKGHTYMPDQLHNYRQCFNCSQIINPQMEVVIKECDIEQDTVIQCQNGYYRKKPRNNRDKEVCVPCSNCFHVTRPCMNYSDVVCCLENYETIEISEHVFACKELPILCKSGHYYRSTTEECLPCPQDTYMPENSHTHPSCLKCAHLSHTLAYNSDILHHCSGSSPTLFGCKPGYFRSLDESLLIEVNCNECHSCQEAQIIRNCSHMEDFICEQYNGKNKSVPQGPCCWENETCFPVSSCQSLSKPVVNIDTFEVHFIVFLIFFVFFAICTILLLYSRVYHRRKSRNGTKVRELSRLDS
uniref:TNFR-Cys domain-containing protein n=2 Tax=Arion vulgaris TaxID=1028688 RepID=A0A0B7A3K3_9EUPU